MKINKEILQEAEKEGLIKSTEELWSFLEKSKRSNVSILNIIGGVMIIFGIILASFMLMDIKQYEIAGILIILTGLSLSCIVNKIDKKDLTFKISNLMVYLLLCFGAGVTFEKFWQYAADLGYTFYALKLLEIPAIILACYYYIKNKNEYMLAIPFLIVTFMFYSWIDLNVDYYIRKGVWLHKVTSILLYMNLIILLLLTYYKKLVTKENVAFIGLILIFNFHALMYFFDMYRIFSIDHYRLNFILTIVFLNLILLAFSSFINKNRLFESLVFGVCFAWLFMIDFFESLIFISTNIMLLAYGIYYNKDKIIRVTVIVLAISIEQIARLEDLLQIMYYIIIGIIFILLNKYLINKKKEKENVELHKELD